MKKEYPRDAFAMTSLIIPAIIGVMAVPAITATPARGQQPTEGQLDSIMAYTLLAEELVYREWAQPREARCNSEASFKREGNAQDWYWYAGWDDGDDENVTKRLTPLDYTWVDLEHFPAWVYSTKGGQLELMKSEMETLVDALETHYQETGGGKEVFFLPWKAVFCQWLTDVAAGPAHGQLLKLAKGSAQLAQWRTTTCTPEVMASAKAAVTDGLMGFGTTPTNGFDRPIPVAGLPYTIGGSGSTNHRGETVHTVHGLWVSRNLVELFASPAVSGEALRTMILGLATMRVCRAWELWEMEVSPAVVIYAHTDAYLRWERLGHPAPGFHGASSRPLMWVDESLQVHGWEGGGAR